MILSFEKLLSALTTGIGSVTKNSYFHRNGDNTKFINTFDTNCERGKKLFEAQNHKFGKKQPFGKKQLNPFDTDSLI